MKQACSLSLHQARAEKECCVLFPPARKPLLLWVFSRSDAMTFFTPTPVQAGVDGSLSDLLAHWIEEQFQPDKPTRRERPYIGIVAAGGTLRDGGWPIYGGGGPTPRALFPARGVPSRIPRLPF